VETGFDPELEARTLRNDAKIALSDAVIALLRYKADVVNRGGALASGFKV